MLDWKALSPHRPLDEGDARYVQRPDGGGERLAQLLRAGGGPVVVVGPTGCGKSTELARAAKVLSGELEVHLVQLDRSLNMRQVDEAQVIECLGRQLQLSQRVTRPSKDDLRNHLRLQRRSGRPVLLIDGLEKAPAPAASAIVKSLLDLGDEAVLALVLSPALVIGPSAYEIVSNARVFPIRALAYWDQHLFALSVHDLLKQVFVRTAPVGAMAGGSWRFFADIFFRRTGEVIAPGDAENVSQIVLQAMVASGGVPRVFLQLLQDAVTYAALAGAESPNTSHLQAAIQDQSDSLALVLQDGDAKALAEAFGTNGLEVPLERKLRFLAHGLLLEYEAEGQRLVYPAPLLYKFFHWSGSSPRWTRGGSRSPALAGYASKPEVRAGTRDP